MRLETSCRDRVDLHAVCDDKESPKSRGCVLVDVLRGRLPSAHNLDPVRVADTYNRQGSLDGSDTDSGDELGNGPVPPDSRDGFDNHRLVAPGG